MIITERLKQVLSSMAIDGNKARLTETLSRKEYVQINEILTTTGGVWSKKEKAHVWQVGNPSDKLNVILNPSTKTVTTTLETQKEKKKAFQFFPTPPELATYIVDKALIQPTDLVLEPSAGDGAIIKSVHKQYPTMTVYAYEIQPELQVILKGIPTVKLLGDDFLKAEPCETFDKIVMNPPFAKNQDIAHIQHAFKFLKQGGRLVSICSHHWTFASDKKSKAFREWLNTLVHLTETIEAGTFKESGTMVSSLVLVIDK
jgi:predicted RNA methylase